MSKELELDEGHSHLLKMSKELELNVYIESIHKALSIGDHEASTVSDEGHSHLLKTLAIRYICEDLPPSRKNKEGSLERTEALARYNFITGTENQVVETRLNGGTWLDGDLDEELLRLQNEQREKENYIDNNVMIPGFDLSELTALESIVSDIKKCIAKQEENKLKIMKVKDNE